MPQALLKMSCSGKKNRIAVVTLGCKLNFAESSSIAQKFIAEGFEEVRPFAVADLYIVNTCTVTEHSDKKCRNLIRRVHSINPDAVIVVTGCYAELKGEEIAAIEGVDAVIGHLRKSEVFETALKLFRARKDGLTIEKKNAEEDSKTNLSVFPAASYGERTRSFLKIQDGCDYFCTYCAIPFARGRSRSVPSSTVLQMARSLAERGVKEIVLTGVNLGDYTRVSREKTLLDLLKGLNEIEGIERYRISSIEPNLLTDEIIDWISSGTKFAPHFHIPLQSGCDSTLKRMNRRYTTEQFASKIGYIREKMGDVFFGIDVIAGFPGETEDEFRRTYRFLSERIKPAFLHIFPYSRRAGTKADSMEGHIAENIKQQRVKELEALSDALHAEYVARFKGLRQKVLFESSVKGADNQRIIEGYTANYIRVTAPYDKNLIGKIIEVTI